MVPRNRSPNSLESSQREHHHLVVRGMQCGAEVPIRHDAAAHRVQDGHIDPALRKQLVGNEFRIRTGYWPSSPSVFGAYSPPGAPYQSIS